MATLARTAVIHARIEPNLKKSVEYILNNLGLTISEAISLFFRQVDSDQGLRLDLHKPNRVTKKAMKDTKSRTNLKKYRNIDEFSKSLEF